MTFFTELYSDSPLDAKVDGPHQPSPKAPPALGHASFRPYSEPLLRPTFFPMDKKTTLPNLDGVEEEQRIITPSKDSTAKLFEPPPSDLAKLLPAGAHKDDYLPAIRLTIRFTAWKQTLQEKCQRAWMRWKLGRQKVNYETGDGHPLYQWNQTFEQRADAAWEKHLQEREALDRLYPASSEEEAMRAGLKDFQDDIDDFNIDDWKIQNDIWAIKATALEAAYNALKAVLFDYERYGLLHYRPLADSSRIWASELKDGVPMFQTIKKVIVSWSQIYDIFTPTRVYSETPSWLEHSWESSILRKYSDLHRQIQLLPSCLLFGAPLFPDPNDSQHTKETYFDEITRVITETADYLSETLEAALRQALISDIHTNSQLAESFRSRITAVLNKGVLRHPLVTYPGPLFLIDDLRKMPSHLIEALPHHASDDGLVAAAIEDYQNNLLKMEDVFEEVLNFPGTKSSEN